MINKSGLINCLAVVLLLQAVVCCSFAQARILSVGKIEYEKKVNMHKQLGDDSWTSEIKDRLPVYRTTYFDLLFDSTSSTFKAGREAPDDKWKSMWGQMDNADNVVHQDFAAGKTTALKQVFEKKFLIQDSLLNIEWRITDETRSIAGFDCRKAVGRFFDSLYVVAFYAEQIASPAGPEQYGGLPGTILGLAFPRYYTTWFATKVELINPKPDELKPPLNSKATRMNRRDLIKQVTNVFKWGSEEEKQRSIWSIVL